MEPKLKEKIDEKLKKLINKLRIIRHIRNSNLYFF